MLFSTAQIRRGSMKIECPDWRRTHSHAARSTSSNAVKSRWLNAIRCASDGALFSSNAICLADRFRLMSLHAKFQACICFSNEKLGLSFLQRAGLYFLEPVVR